MSNEPTGHLSFPGEIRRFILGGNSIFTIVEGDKRYTYKVRTPALDRAKNWSTGNQDKTQRFVSVLYGPDNESDYRYLGMMRQNVDGALFFAKTAKSLSEDDPRFQLFSKYWAILEYGCRVMPGTDFWHEGQCCVCGRKLTVPESIASGIGPECASGGM